MNIINLYEKYVENKAIFENISKIASKTNTKIYLVGGIVRDILLNRPNFDVDICVQGDAIEFAKIVESIQQDAKIISIHKDFETAKIRINNLELDLASTRIETYPKKGHLPLVSKIGCPLEDDVSRRDFSINSMVMSLNQEEFGELIDYLDGRRDLDGKTLRVLYPTSFIDDPSRILRGLKFTLRFGFELDKKSLELQTTYLENIDKDMCYKRIKDELKDLFLIDGGFNKLVESGAYKLITPKVPAKNSTRNWIVGLGILTDNIDRFELNKNEKNIISNAHELLKQKITTDFEIYKSFRNQPLESLLIYDALSGNNNVEKYLNNLSKIKLEITGKDLILLGYNPSKKFRECLEFVLAEKIQSSKMSKDEELKLAEKFLKNKS